VLTIEAKTRQCGKRKDGGVYLVGGTFQSAEGTLLPFSLISPPIPYPAGVHRNARIVNGDAILEKLPLNEWWFGSSKATEDKKLGDAWAIDIFGMPIAKRIGMGECARVKTADDAMEVLVGKVKFDSKPLLSHLRSLAENRVSEITRVALAYNKLHEHILAYTRTGDVRNLIHAQAAVWQIADRLPPSKRDQYTYDLAGILTRLGLVRDAGVLIRSFSN